jgi:hypothetical protein
MEIYSSDEMRAQRRIEARSGADGSYLLEGLLPELSYSLIVLDGDHAPEQRGGIRPGGPAENFYLNQGARISGRVIWEEDESPVEGATVSLGINAGRSMNRTFQEWGAAFQLDSATTDASGAFSLGGLRTERRLPLFASYSESKTVVFRSNLKGSNRGGEHRTGVDWSVAAAPLRLYGVGGQWTAPGGRSPSQFCTMGGGLWRRPGTIFRGERWGNRRRGLVGQSPRRPADRTETAPMERMNFDSSPARFGSGGKKRILWRAEAMNCSSSIPESPNTKWTLFFFPAAVERDGASAARQTHWPVVCY